MYSAVKVGGVPLYKSARAGRTIARDTRAVVIHALEMLGIEGRDVTLRIVCSKGTYVRTLCADIGEALGIGGHMLTLQRRRVGPLTIDHALTVDEVVNHHALGRLGDDLLSLDQALDRLAIMVVDGQTADRVRHGAPVAVTKILRWDRVADRMYGSRRPVRIHDIDGHLIAIAICPESSDGSFKVEKVLTGQDV